MKQKNVGFGLDRTEKGITLVALVLTIIIMLILAGISFSLVMGDNGIIDKAIKARDVQNLSVAEEQIALKAADYGGEYYLRIYKDRDLDEDNGVCAYIAERLNGEFDDYTFSTENKMVTVKKDNETQAVGVILEDGSIGWNGKSAFGPVNTTYIADFGKKVIGYTGYTAYNENDEWRLFYADNYCAYLIKNSIGNKTLTNSTLFPDFDSETISQLGKNLNSKCLENFWNHNNSHNNIKAVAGLLDTTKWADYANNTANWAIGAPTLEIFIASYNATHTAEAIATYKAIEEHSEEDLVTTQIDCKVENDSACGYIVKQMSESEFMRYTTGLGNSSILDKAIYCHNNESWWLASSSARDTERVMFVGWRDDGYLNCGDYYGYCGVRPLVYIPLSRIGTGAGKIEIGDF